MEHIISATQARIHFGEVMRRARHGPVIVERDGVQEVVVISKHAYDQLTAATPQPGWRELLKKTHDQLRLELKGRLLPDPAEMIRLGREERDEQLLDSLR
jgi:prevent-host-death family protein